MAAAHAVIQFSTPAMDCAFHPSQLALTVGTADGAVESYTLKKQEKGVETAEGEEFVRADEGWVVKDLFPDESCRCVCYTQSGALVLTGSSGGDIIGLDSQTGDESFDHASAHDGELSHVFAISENVVATGDENGVVRLWDPRQAFKAIGEYTDHTDFISDFAYHSKGHCLVSTSGDGTIGVFDIRKSRLRAQSESDADDEYCSVVVMKKGKKVVVGTQQGVLSIFSWGHFNDCSDRFPGHPESIDALVAYDDNTLLTAAGDGAIRILSVLPNKLVGVLGTHEADTPVEQMAMSFDRSLLATISHTEDIKVWDLQCLQDDSGDEEEPDADAAGARMHARSTISLCASDTLCARGSDLAVAMQQRKPYMHLQVALTDGTCMLRQGGPQVPLVADQPLH